MHTVYISSVILVSEAASDAANAHPESDSEQARMDNTLEISHQNNRRETRECDTTYEVVGGVWQQVNY